MPKRKPKPKALVPLKRAREEYEYACLQARREWRLSEKHAWQDYVRKLKEIEDAEKEGEGER